MQLLMIEGVWDSCCPILLGVADDLKLFAVELLLP
jgi:hypothetical protein